MRRLDALLLRLARVVAPLWVLTWLPLLVVVWHLRRTVLMINGGGYEYVERVLVAAGRQLDGLDLAALFARDAILFACVLPAIGLIATTRLSARMRGIAFGIVQSILISVVYLEIQVLWQVGGYLPAEVLIAGLGDINRQHLGDYVIARDALIPAALVAASWCAISVVAWIEARGTSVHRRDFLAAGVLLAIGSILFVGTHLRAIQDNPYDRSDGYRAVAAFFALGLDAGAADSRREAGTLELVREIRSLTGSGMAGRHSRAHAALRGYDVVMLVMETAPAECVDLLVANGKMPALARALAGGITFDNHFTTYPYTTRAIFSIYSSWYPSNFLEDHVRRLERLAPGATLVAPGLARALTYHGYETAIFVPENPIDNWEKDEERYKALGFQRIFYPDPRESRVAPSFPDPERPIPARSRARLAMDQEVFALLEKELADRRRDGRRFFYAFHPQVTHGPWSDSQGSSLRDTCSAGAELFSVVDGWLAKLVASDDASSNGASNRTLLVVTADHGIRTREEHAGFNGGTLDDVTYRVPLVVLPPAGALTPGLAIEQPTSHVDVSPTLLDLLGVDECRRMELGLPGLSEILVDRRALLLGRNYLGADGFVSGHEMFMWKHAIDGFASLPWKGHLGFAPDQLAIGKDGLAPEGAAILRESWMAQDALASRMLAGDVEQLCRASTSSGSR